MIPEKQLSSHAGRTIGAKLLGLRKQLDGYPQRDDCAPFAKVDLYTLGMSFFPGGIGVYKPERTSISTIILGSDWGNEESLSLKLAAKTYRKEAAVTGAVKMLKAAGLDPEDCFFSNAWPVMRAGTLEEDGYHPMRDDPEFTSGYREFLRVCIRDLDPKLVITLGFAPAWFVGPLIGPSWRCGLHVSSTTLRSRDIDVEPAQMKHGPVFVAMTHPSHANNAKYRDLAEGDVSETDLLTRARRMAGIEETS
jgi:uracil-DNA glycosylase